MVFARHACSRPASARSIRPHRAAHSLASPAGAAQDNAGAVAMALTL